MTQPKINSDKPGKGRGSSEVRAVINLATCRGKAPRLSAHSFPLCKKNEVTGPMNSDSDSNQELSGGRGLTPLHTRKSPQTHGETAAAQRKEDGIWNPKRQIGVLALPPASWVTSGQALSLSEVQIRVNHKMSWTSWSCHFFQFQHPVILLRWPKSAFDFFRKMVEC